MGSIAARGGALIEGAGATGIEMAWIVDADVAGSAVFGIAAAARTLEVLLDAAGLAFGFGQPTPRVSKAAAVGGAFGAVDADAGPDAGTGVEMTTGSMTFWGDADTGGTPVFAVRPAQYSQAPAPASTIPTSTAKIRTKRGVPDADTEFGIGMRTGDTMIGGGRFLPWTSWPFFNASKIKLIEQ
jgi:hypothetical protein